MWPDIHPLPPNQPRVGLFDLACEERRRIELQGEGMTEPQLGETEVLGIDRHKVRTRLQNKALLVAALAGGARHESSAGGVLKDLADTLAGSGRALQVLVGTDLLGNSLSLRACVSFIDAVSRTKAW